jgi:hypothetical protein
MAFVACFIAVFIDSSKEYSCIYSLSYNSAKEIKQKSNTCETCKKIKKLIGEI